MLLAEALVLPDAAHATITRQGRQPIVVDLKDASLSSTLVIPGDAIKVSGMTAAPAEFYFVGGEISSPGQKPYHAGLTLTQAIPASGGVNRSAGTQVRVSRQGADGRLVTQEYNFAKDSNWEDSRSRDTKRRSHRSKSRELGLFFKDNLQGRLFAAGPFVVIQAVSFRLLTLIMRAS